MADLVPGTPVHFEGASADASAGLNLLPHSPGDPGTLTGGMAGRVLALTDLTILSTPGGSITLLSVTATGTLTLFAGVVAANGGVSRPWNIPVWGLRSGSLILTAPSGQVNIQAEGSLVY